MQNLQGAVDRKPRPRVPFRAGDSVCGSNGDDVQELPLGQGLRARSQDPEPESKGHLACELLVRLKPISQTAKGKVVGDNLTQP